MGLSSEGIEDVVSRVENVLYEQFKKRSYDFTFTSVKLAKWLDISPYRLCRYLRFLEAGGVIVRMGWMSRGRVVYRTQFKRE